MVITRRKYLASFLLILFSLYYVNITFFPHSHIIGDKVITHSHYYGGITTSAQSAHTHTQTDLTIISELSLFLALALVLAILQFGLKPGDHKPFVILAVVPSNRNLEPTIQLRAPPAIS